MKLSAPARANAPVLHLLNLERFRFVGFSLRRAWRDPSRGPLFELVRLYQIVEGRPKFRSRTYMQRGQELKHPVVSSLCTLEWWCGTHTIQVLHSHPLWKAGMWLRTGRIQSYSLFMLFFYFQSLDFSENKRTLSMVLILCVVFFKWV